MKERIGNFIRDTVELAPGACATATAVVVGFITLVVYGLHVQDWSTIGMLVVWLVLSAVAVRLGALWDLRK
jgi:hypothetical protein